MSNAAIDEIKRRNLERRRLSSIKSDPKALALKEREQRRKYQAKLFTPDEDRREKENLAGLLALEKKDISKFKHSAIKEFLKEIKGKGLFNESFEKELKELINDLKKFQKLKQEVDKSKQSQHESRVVSLIPLQKKISKDITVIKITLEETKNTLEKMAFNFSFHAETRAKMAALAGEIKLKNENTDVLKAMVLRFHSDIRKIRDLFLKIARRYTLFSNDLIEHLNEAWKDARENNTEIDSDQILFFENTMRNNINSFIIDAEKLWRSEKEDKNKERLIRRLTIQILRSNLKKKKKIISKVTLKSSNGPLKTFGRPERPKQAKYAPRSRLTIARPTKPEKVSLWQRVKNWFSR